MINARRFEVALALGLIPLVLMSLVVVFRPTTGMALAGNPGSPGARVYTESMLIDRFSLSGSSIDGVTVARYQIGGLRRGQRFIMERDFVPGGMIPGAGTYTVRLETPTIVVTNGLVISASNSCLQGVGITQFGLLAGLVDPFLNKAVAGGFQTNLLVELVNLIGPLGLVDFSTQRFWAEAMQMQAGRIQATSGLRVTVTPWRTDPVFGGSCL